MGEVTYDALSGMVINVVTVIDVELLIVENANGLADVMNALEFS